MLKLFKNIFLFCYILTLNPLLAQQIDSPELQNILLSKRTVSETNRPFALIGTVYANIDSGDLVFSIINGEGGEDSNNFLIWENKLYLINFEEGEISYETKSVYHVLIQCQQTDGRNIIIEKSFDILVKNINEAPIDIELEEEEISLGAGFGDEITVIKAIDEDENDFHSFRLVPGEGSDDNASFRIIEDRLLSARFGFRRPNFNIRIRCEDRRGLAYEKAFVLTTNIGLERLSQFSDEKTQVNVYPNPATDMLYVEKEGVSNLEVYDINGRKLLSKKLNQNNKHSLDISSLQNGNYFLNLKPKTNKPDQRVQIMKR